MNEKQSFCYYLCKVDVNVESHKRAEGLRSRPGASDLVREFIKNGK